MVGLTFKGYFCRFNNIVKLFYINIHLKITIGETFKIIIIKVKRSHKTILHH